MRLNDKRCPMTATIMKAASVERKLHVNGVETSI